MNDLSKVKEDVNKTIEKLNKVMQISEVLDNALYFAAERKDKDITKSCAGSAELISELLLDTIDLLYDVQNALEKG